MSGSSPANSRPSRAPEKSAALLALQGKGLELPSLREDSVSPQSNPALDNSLRLSPLSIISTPSNCERSLESCRDHEIRQISATSPEAELSSILDLYMNLSKQSLKSDYEELAAESDSEDMEEERTSVPTFHQPKAYRDTIAPLLEHQFSGERLTVPAMPSPLSVASMPLLLHPNASHSIPSLDLTPEASPNLLPLYETRATISGTSIQSTPKMSPVPSTQFLAIQRNKSVFPDEKIALEVLDVREADSWYDQLLSPVSPEEIGKTPRDSQLSAVSPDDNEEQQRQLTFDALAPPQPRRSPSAQPVDYYEDMSLPGPSRAIVSEIIDNRMVPPPLDLNRSKSPGISPGKSKQIHQQWVNVSLGQHSAALLGLAQHDPIEGPMRTYLTPPPIDRMSSISPGSNLILASDIEEIYRSGSAFSDSTLDSPVAMAKFGKHLKKALKGNFGREKDRTKNKTRKRRVETSSAPVSSQGSGQYTDEVESYKYVYWKSHASAPAKADNILPPPHRLLSPGMESARRLSVQSHHTNLSQTGPGPSVRASPHSVRLTSGSGERSTSRNQNWYEASRQRNTHDSLTSQASTGDNTQPGYTQQFRPLTRLVAADMEHMDPLEADRFSSHDRPMSRTSHAYATNESTNAFHQSTEAGPISRPSSSGFSGARNSAGMPASYNNDLFEASGGKKRSGFASRLLMSAEEKRKQKVKESIVVVGGARMGTNGRRDNGKALVKT